MRNLLCAGAAIAVSLLTACGSGNSTTTPANIRIVNDTSTTLTLELNQSASSAATAPKSSSAYAAVTPSTYSLSVASANGSGGTSSVVGLGTAQNYTALAYQRGGNIYSAVYTDNQATQAAGLVSLDVANLSQDAGPLDVYVVSPPSTDISLLSPTFASVQGLSNVSTFASAPTKYDIIVTGAGSPSDIRLTLLNQQFSSTQPYTLAFTPTVGGGLVNAVLIPQGINVTAGSFIANTQARVRIWSALVTTPTATGVQASIGISAGTAVTLPTDNVAPFPIPYQLVPDGSSIQSLTVGGAAVTIPAATFAAGGDYTIVVYGSVGAPLVAVLSDDNQIIANKASIRLINAAVTGTSGVTMLVNGSNAAFGVGYGSDLNVVTNGGTPTAYQGITPASSATVSLGGGNYSYAGAPLTHAFNSGSVYTAFLYDPTLPPIIITDR